MLTLGCLVLLFSAVHLQIEGPPRSIDTKDLQRAALAAINAQTRNLLCLLPYKILSASKLNSTGYEVKFEVIQSETGGGEAYLTRHERKTSMKLLCAVVVIALFGVAMSGMTGGWKKVDPESDDVKELSWSAVKKINAESNDLFHLVPVKVLSAESQVVAGINYKLEMEVAQSNCAKNQVSHEKLKASPCELKEDPRRHLYVVKIWVKPWENFEQVTIESSKQL
ncbi:hypothetical protein QR680_004857 [Steinernema hermaphroditum]|uniref:Cystatin domain-containing protein n=1 Tax=Steinernema hermaphroditum TaxID=289476 RepID=A0AA39LUD3_9BILA|nr:hypothetical protein QR680_004857 [Steinernema hermaphroditum]